MTATPSATCPHPGQSAVYRCDGCGEHLCAECGESSHRLVFCRLCGERALPLEPSSVEVGRTGTHVDRRRDAIARSATGYGWSKALHYVFRGAGAQVYLGYVLTLSALDLLSAAVPMVGGLVTLVPSAAVMLLLPKFLFSVANHTAQGKDELPGWPDFDAWELLRAALLFLWVVALCLLPAWLLLRVADCAPGAILLGGAPLGACLAVLAVGLLVAVALWVPAFGAVSLFDTFVAALRLDLHARALAVAPAEILLTVPLLTGLLILHFVLPTLLGFLPVVGSILGHVVVGYALFTGAHLVGLYFRRHWRELEELYLD